MASLLFSEQPNNFKAHLDGGTFEHRSLIADGRNETEWVNLRDEDAFSVTFRRRNDSASSMDSLLRAGYHHQDARSPTYNYQSCQEVFNHPFPRPCRS